MSGELRTTQGSDGAAGAHAIGTPGSETSSGVGGRAVGGGEGAHAVGGGQGAHAVGGGEGAHAVGGGQGAHAVGAGDGDAEGTPQHGPARGSQLQFGPAGEGRANSAFNSRQLTRLDEALTLSSQESGLYFSIYVGDLRAPTRGHAETLFERLTDAAVLLAVSPGQRILHIVTGPESSKRLPNRACALAALAMRASFSNGDLTGGIVIGLRMLADSAGHA